MLDHLEAVEILVLGKDVGRARGRKKSS